ncbi:hypothetical protein J6590_083843 [Homalodisca vitripennis]|nr:hypothetical protein J6590_083843 [Homalodisca vitripennis]
MTFFIRVSSQEHCSIKLKQRGNNAAVPDMSVRLPKLGIPPFQNNFYNYHMKGEEAIRYCVRLDLKIIIICLLINAYIHVGFNISVITRYCTIL